MAEGRNGGRALPPPRQQPAAGSGSPDGQRDSQPRSPYGAPESYHYPPPSNEADDRRHQPPHFQLPPMSQPNVTLPPIQGLYSASYAPSSVPVNPPLVDPRLSTSNYATSPTAANGYGPPQPGPGPQNQNYPSHGGPPPGALPPPGAPPHGSGHPQGHYGDPYAGQHRPSSYPPPPPGGPYGAYPGYPPAYGYGGEYGQPGHQQQQIAPRQRTSIACRYCRKRKIRCSGYQNTTNGKCINCDKLRIECIFQPVSSGVATAFIPVSAVPGGVPPGTQLFGAYGQPLPPSGPSNNPGPYGPPPPGYPQHQQQQQQQQHQQHQQHQQQQHGAPLASPTSQYAPQHEGQQQGRRRPREEDDEEDRNSRLPPPAPANPYNVNYESRRRSPASTDSNTPPMYHYQHSTRSFEVDRTPTPRRNSGGHSPTNSTTRSMSTGITSPTSANGPPPSMSTGLAPPNSSGQGPPNGQRLSGGQPTSSNARPLPTSNGRGSPNVPAPGSGRNPSTKAEGGSSSIMSLGNLVQGPPPTMSFKGSDIDTSMLGKLNRHSS